MHHGMGPYPQSGSGSTYGSQSGQYGPQGTSFPLPISSITSLINKLQGTDAGEILAG